MFLSSLIKLLPQYHDNVHPETLPMEAERNGLPYPSPLFCDENDKLQQSRQGLCPEQACLHDNDREGNDSSSFHVQHFDQIGLRNEEEKNVINDLMGSRGLFCDVVDIANASYHTHI